MSISETLGYRHIRFTRTVKAEIEGRGCAVDLRLEGNFPLDFQPDRYELDLSGSKGDGRVTVRLDPAPPEGTELLDVGADAVGVFNAATETVWIDLDAEIEAGMTKDRAQEISLEMVLLTAKPDLVMPARGKGALLAGAALKPLRRI